MASLNIAVLGLLDGLELRADQLDAVFLQDAALGQLDREVQAVWPPRVGSSMRPAAPSLDDLFQVLRRERLDVGAVGQLGIGHDRRRVRVDQHDLDSPPP